MLCSPTLLDQKLPGSPPAFGRLALVRQRVSKAGRRQSVGTYVRERFVLERRIPGHQEGVESVEEHPPVFGRRPAGHPADQAHRRKCGKAGMTAIVVARIGPSWGRRLRDSSIGKIDQAGYGLGAEARSGQAESNPFNQIDLSEKMLAPMAGMTAERTLAAFVRELHEQPLRAEESAVRSSHHDSAELFQPRRKDGLGLPRHLQIGTIEVLCSLRSPPAFVAVGLGGLQHKQRYELAIPGPAVVTARRGNLECCCNLVSIVQDCRVLEDLAYGVREPKFVQTFEERSSVHGHDGRDKGQCVIVDRNRAFSISPQLSDRWLRAPFGDKRIEWLALDRKGSQTRFAIDVPDTRLQVRQYRGPCPGSVVKPFPQRLLECAVHDVMRFNQFPESGEQISCLSLVR